MKRQTIFAGFDFYNWDMRLTDKGKSLRQEVREFVEFDVLPAIHPCCDKAKFPWAIARKMIDAEIICTYESTNEVDLLLVGRELTGLNAIV